MIFTLPPNSPSATPRLSTLYPPNSPNDHWKPAEIATTCVHSAWLFHLDRMSVRPTQVNVCSNGPSIFIAALGFYGMGVPVCFSEYPLEGVCVSSSWLPWVILPYIIRILDGVLLDKWSGLAGSSLRANVDKYQLLSYTVLSLFLVTNACPACLAVSHIFEISSGSRWFVEKLIEFLDHVWSWGLSH